MPLHFTDCFSNIQKVIVKHGAEEGAKTALEALSENYHGHAGIGGMLAAWLVDLKSSSSSSSDNDGKKEDSMNAAADEVRNIVQDVIKGITKEKFDKTKADEVLNMSKSETLYIQEMIQSSRWRKLLIDLATTNKDSALLKYCIRIISDLGYHRELARRINMTDDFSVYNSTLKAEFGAIGTLVSSVPTDAESSMDMSEIVEDIRRMCTSASYTYLYAVEVSHDRSDRMHKLFLFLSFC